MFIYRTSTFRQVSHIRSRDFSLTSFIYFFAKDVQIYKIRLLKIFSIAQETWGLPEDTNLIAFHFYSTLIRNYKEDSNKSQLIAKFHNVLSS
jgi:hypothetical protein